LRGIRIDICIFGPFVERDGDARDLLAHQPT
jgi:hypothetical protein